MDLVTETDDSRPVSQRVVEAVAAEKETDSTELEPLYHSIDPDSLDELFHGRSSTFDRTVDRITFEFSGYRVTVSTDGAVELTPITEADAETPPL